MRNVGVAEIVQPDVKDRKNGEVEAIPGVTMPVLKVVWRDYQNPSRQCIWFGPAVRKPPRAQF